MNLKIFRRKWMWVVMLLIVAMLWLFWPSSKYEIYRVLSGPLKVNVMVPGKVESVSGDVRLSFDRLGTIEKIHVKEGDKVEKGMILAELAHDDLEAQVEVAKWAVEEAKENIPLMEVDKTYWEARLKRREQMGTVVSLEDLEQSELQFHQADGKLAISRAHLKMKEGEFLVAQANLERAFLKAPMGGSIVRVLAREGETVMTSVEPQPVAILANMEHLRIRAEVDESQIHKVHLGQKAFVVIEAFASETIPAQVIQILDVMGRRKIEVDDPKAKEDTTVLEILLEVEKRQSLKLGLRVDVTIEVASEENALLIPRSYVSYDAQGAQVLKKKGWRLVSERVQLGMEQELLVEVKSGLKEGDVLVRRRNL